ncbi:choice-of-anchor D domain-containing protein [Sediminicola luteus]|uniref:HYDIN/VesB/CFA65-like Ig-like domain-containing protein n=1 Tax=Sediminicola luteus TaxID=319238 RepID=A0A2A4GAJ3_9FLAO|nr:choice-of-anchor D domain-containing protein [Sediminicola luteus]PCE64998.1 hypothetical protein B7P33_07530 [Sediminicola luteus]
MNLVRYFLGTFLLFFVFTLSCCSSNDQEEVKEVPESKVEETAVINVLIDDSNEIDFGDVVVGITTTRIFSVQNTGNSTLNINNVRLPSGFTIDVTSVNISPDTTKEFVVTFSPSEILDYSGSIEIESNATEGDESILISGFGVDSIFEGSVVLNTQDEVESFAQLGYTEITGALNIGNINTVSQITSLASLNEIVYVGSLQVVSTGKLENLDGLENLDVGISIQLLSNYALKDIDALLGVTKLSSYLSLLSNKELTNLNGLSNIQEVGDNLRIKNHPKLKNLDGLSEVTSIKEDLIVEGNELIEDLNGLSSIKSVVDIRISGNFALYNYCGIKSLIQNKGYSGGFGLTSFNRYNPSVYDIVYSDCSNEIPEGVYHGDYSIHDTYDIRQLTVRDYYHTIDGDLTISESWVDNEKKEIRTLEDLKKIKSIKGKFEVKGTLIKDLTGLENLESVEQIVFIGNAQLSDYCGLNSLLQNGNLGEGFYGEPGEEYMCSGNLYNPSLLDLQNAKCAE